MIWNEAMLGERILETYCKQAQFTYDNANNVMHYRPARIIIKTPLLLCFTSIKSLGLKL